MSTRPLWILKSRRSASGRKHMAIFIPNSDHIETNANSKTAACLGTKIHVTGAPMAGFCHEFQRNYSCSDPNLASATRVTDIDAKYIIDPVAATFSTDQTALGKGCLDDLALKVPAPGITKDYLNPANVANIRDCQNWIVDYVRYLAKRNVVEEDAVGIAESCVDPQLGISLKHVSKDDTSK